jgi:hypothetical protein
VYLIHCRSDVREIIDVLDGGCSVGGDGIDLGLALFEYFWVLSHCETEREECC